jgi:tetratricopeptide (TPR) repeat protein
MRIQAYLLAITLLAVLTPQHGVSATLNLAELSSRNETKIVQADILVEASSGQGELVAQARGDEFGKAEALSTITLALAGAGKIDQALQVIKEIKKEINNKARENRVLSEIAFRLALSGKINQALQLAQEIKDEFSNAEALSNIASALGSSGNFNQAIQIAQTAKNKYYQAGILAMIATELTSSGQTELGSRIFNQALDMVTSY